MTQEKIDQFEKVQSQIEGLYTEISALSKKSQNDPLNKFKLKFVNQLLIEANALLEDAYRPFADFSVFDENDLPTNSDAALMLMQYLNCLEKLRIDNIQKEPKFPQHWFWLIDGKLSSLRTTSPKNFK